MTMLDASPPIGGLSPIHEGIHPRRELRQRPILGPAGVLIARLSIVSRIRQICFGICGWRNWRRVRDLDDPAGYLYRVEHRVALRLAKKRPHLALPADSACRDSRHRAGFEQCAGSPFGAAAGGVWSFTRTA